MAVDLPTEVVVGPCRYQIEADVHSAVALRDEHGDMTVGDHDGARLKIRVDPTQPPDGQAVALLHELLHALWLSCGLRPVRALDRHEEHVVTVLAPALLDTLRRNPALADYLLAC